MFDFVYGRAFFIRMIMLLAAATLMYIGVSTIYATDHPVYQPREGATSLAAVSYEHPHNWHITDFEKWEEWQKQLVFAAAGFIGLIAVNTFHYRKLGVWSYWIYGLSLFLLAFVLLGRYFPSYFSKFVPVKNGACAWIKLPGVPQIQPSEFARLTFIIALAWYLRYKSNYRSFGSLLGPFAITFIMLFLILLEPDLGTVLLMIPVLFAMLFVAGARARHLITIIIITAVLSPFLYTQLAPYQKSRIAIIALQSDWVRDKVQQNPKIAQFLIGKPRLGNIDRDEGYQLLQSKLAIASGEGFGHGYRRGPYVQYNILPERHNDFIFSIFAHQYGFFGSVCLLVLYIILLACGLEIARQSPDPFGRLIAVGIVALFTAQVIVNVSVTLGLMPLTGLTLPLVSYGGSSLVVCLMAIGLLNNIGRARPFSAPGEGF